MTVRSLIALAAMLLVVTSAAAQTPAPATGAAPAGAAQQDPVVARVNGTELHRSEVLAARQMLPAQVQQIPFDQVYPQLLDSLVTNLLAAQAGRKQKLADDPEVKKRLQWAQDQIIEEVYLGRYIRGAMTDDKIKARYDQFVKDQKPQDQVNAKHILVKTEDEAKAVITDLKGGGDFAAIAKEKSNDPGTKATGGDLGWFTKDEMVPEFAEAAFKLQKGQYTETPVKTQFGYHVIMLVDRRTAPPPTMEEARPQVVALLQRELIEQKVKELRTSAKIETFNLDGSKPSATPAPAAPAAPAKPKP
ncbi:MAG TPA: peptidylprolyl isomerase [Stellaceae bacterium]|nr:peptidylprolyl isomerase [Stellaceae bacterium]